MPALANAAAILAPTATLLRASAAVTAGTGTTIIDTLDYDGQGLCTITVTAYSSGTANFVIECSPVSNFASGVATAATVAAVTATGVYSAAVDLAGMPGRYLRVNTGSGDTFAGITASASFHAVKKLL